MTSGTEDVALELLHAELVSQVCSKPLGSQERAKALSDLELVGYNAGYRHVLLLTIITLYILTNLTLKFIILVIRLFWILVQAFCFALKLKLKGFKTQASISWII